MSIILIMTWKLNIEVTELFQPKWVREPKREPQNGFLPDARNVWGDGGLVLHENKGGTWYIGGKGIDIVSIVKIGTLVYKI